jgi:heme-degrading monooxygenase HmoA
MIRHTVIFTTKHAAGSAAERQFVEDALVLAKIPGVKNFERLKQVHAKNPHRFGFSMEFDNQAAYDGYSNHPEHTRFVNEKWIPNVADFLEIDYERV